MSIKTVVVIGSGTMGSGIAAHLANVDRTVHLLDLPGKTSRNEIVERSIDNIKKSDPPLLFHKKKIENIFIGNLEDNFDVVGQADWIIEAVVERIDIKHQLYEKIDQVRKPNCIVSSNTSTIPLSILTEKMSEEMKDIFCITHFFNPVRFMRLLEIVERSDTSTDKLDTLRSFCQNEMGKGIVECRDTPGFIGNRIGVYAIQCAMYEAIERKLSVEIADAIFGRPMGIPKTGVFGLYDLIGIDLMKDVLLSFEKELQSDDAFHEYVAAHPVVEELLAKGFKGNKSGCGFYEIHTIDGDEVSKALNYSDHSYYDFKKVDISLLKETETQGISRLLDDDSIYGEYAFKVFSKTVLYCCQLMGEISDDIVNIDNALKWGFNWYQGPFEMLHEYGLDKFYNRCQKNGDKIPQYLEKLYLSKQSCYSNESLSSFSHNGKLIPINVPKNTYRLCDLKRISKPVMQNESASSWLIRDDQQNILVTEFHTKANALNGPAMEILQQTIENVSKYEASGIVVYNEAMNFSAGADLNTMINFADRQAWSEIDIYLKNFQDTCAAMKYAPFPVISAVSGLAIGGGFEVACQTDKMLAHMNCTLGLVETGVGLVPGGGGCKVLLERWTQDKSFSEPDDGALEAFNIIGYGLTASSPIQAKKQKFFIEGRDSTVNNRDDLLFTACKMISELKEDYNPVAKPNFCLSGSSLKDRMHQVLLELEDKKIISGYDIDIGLHLAHVMSGGQTDKSKILSEQDIYDLERESLINLIKNQKTRDKIHLMLEEGRRLKN